MPVLNSRRRVGIFLPACTSILLLALFPAAAQNHAGILKGKVIDGSTHRTLYSAAVTTDGSSVTDTSDPAGQYKLMLPSGKYSITFSHEGFQSKVITGVSVQTDDVHYLDIILYPMAVRSFPTGDSVRNSDSSLKVSAAAESRQLIYHPLVPIGSAYESLPEGAIQPGTDKDATHVLQRLNGVVVENGAGSSPYSTLNISGFGERFNQVLLNGAPMSSFTPAGRSYPLELIPVEAIKEVSVHRSADPSLPADYVGGLVNIETKDMPDNNFFYVRAGAGFSDATTGKTFYTDKQGSLEWLGLPGSVRNLPGTIPSTWSRIPLDVINPQQRALISKDLKNNLAPVKHGSASPDEKVVLGLGRIIPLKKGTKLGIIAYIEQQHASRIDEASIQVSPDVSSNPYPFVDPNKILVRTLASDTRYNYYSRLSGVFNASIVYGKNKISFRNLVGRQFTNTFNRRSQVFKADEDSLAHTGLNYRAEEATIINPQLCGEHAFGGDGKFKLSWLASYAYYHRRMPDERNYLLRQDSTGPGLYELAHPLFVTQRVYDVATTVRSLQMDFQNSGRKWTDMTDHNVNGHLDISVPFHLRKRVQELSGGVGFQARYRSLSTDLIRILDGSGGYYALDKLWDPQRFYPGGLNTYSFFNNGLDPRGITNPPSANTPFQDESFWSDYVASSNLGTAYLRLKGSVSRLLSFNLGLRLESYGQLVSNTAQAYNVGFKYPEQLTINKNGINGKTDLLPTAELISQPLASVRLHAALFRTVNRAQLQELSYYKYYDADAFTISAGNPLMSNSVIDNYEAGIDWLFRTMGHLSITGFFKRIDQPIENILFRYSDQKQNNILNTPYNTAPTDVKGITASFRTSLGFMSDDASLLRDLTFFAGGTWQRARVPAGPIKTTITPFVPEHTLSGSPDYIINAGLTLQHAHFPAVTILYNRMADYITAVGSAPLIYLENKHSVSSVPDYRLKGRDQLDLQVSHKFMNERIQLIAGVNNLTNSAYIQYQDLNGNKKFDKPLSLTIRDNGGGYYNSGVDNNVLSIKPQRTYYLTVSYLFL